MGAAGRLRREPHQRDRRLVPVFLTEWGRELELVIGRAMERISERALATFDDAERAARVRSLSQTRANRS